MTHSSTETRKIANSKALYTVVFAIAMITFTLNGSNARAVNVMPSDYRLELPMGTISASQENRLFVSLGPMRRPLVIHEQNVVTRLTNRLLARHARVVLQAFPGSFPANINTETVGLSSTNPGMDMIRLNTAFDFSDG